MTTTTPTINAAFQAYLLAQQSRGVVPSYRGLLELTRRYLVQRLGDLALEQVTPDLIRAWLVWLRGEEPAAAQAAPSSARGKALSSASVDVHYRNLKAFLTWCEDEELLPRSPMRKIKRPRVTSTLPDVLTESESLTLLEKVRTDGDKHAHRDYCIILFFLDTGVRLAELCGLLVSEVNLEGGWARVLGKGRKERLVPLGIELRRHLAKYLLKDRRPVAGEQALFLNEDGLRFEAQGVRTMVLRSLRDYVPRKLSKSGPHTLRHTFATLNLRATRDMKGTSLILGHSTTRTTERYLHLVGADVLRNAEGSPMDALMRGKTG